MDSFNDLIGLPYVDLGRERSGVDCYGLVCLAYAKLGITLPSYAGLYLGHEEREEIAAVIAGGLASMWTRITDAPRPHDMLVFRRGGMDLHVGLVVVLGLMLHADMTAPSRIESYNGPRWKPRLTGIYRHRDLI